MSAASADKFLGMSVDNIGFLLDRLGQDCAPLKYLRELTQNSIEAILRAGGKGEIIWDVDWTTYELTDGPRVMKLCITDNGYGMTGDEMVKYINQLSSSLSSQSMSGNYGVGAKIAAVTRNPLGVLYLSWKDKVGAHIHMLKHRIGVSISSQSQMGPTGTTCPSLTRSSLKSSRATEPRLCSWA